MNAAKKRAHKLEAGRTESIQGVASNRTNRSLVAFSSFAERTHSTLYVVRMPEAAVHEQRGAPPAETRSGFPGKSALWSRKRSLCVPKATSELMR